MKNRSIWILIPVVLLAACCVGGLVGVFGFMLTGAGHGPHWAFVLFMVGYRIAVAAAAGLAVYGIGFAVVVVASRSRPLWQKTLAVVIPFGLLSLAYQPFIDDQILEAVFKGSVSKYELMRKLGAKCDLDDDLWLAARWGHYELVEHLISIGANVNAKYARSGDRVLTAALENLASYPDGNRRVIKLLLDHGADPDAITRADESVIQMAKQTSRTQEVIDLLINYSKAAKK